MCAQPVDRHWFISRDGKRYGPYTFEALAAAAAKGVIDGETVVWRLGWVQWHPAGRVPGLIPEQALEPEQPEIEEVEDAPRDLDAHEVPPLADDPLPRGTAGDAVGAAATPSLRRAVPRRTPRRDAKDAFAAPEKPTPDVEGDKPADDGAAGRKTPRPLAEAPAVNPPQREGMAGVPEVRPQRREDLAIAKPAVRRRGRFAMPAAIGFVVVLLAAGAGWGLFRSGLIALVEPRPPASGGGAGVPQTPERPTLAAASGLPEMVATLPAVEALAVHDRAAFDRFTKRFAATAANAPDDELMSLARAALRKSVKRVLANSAGDTLLEITDTYLAYMKELTAVNPESCVALSDESKGAKLTANLAKEFPILFIRDMAVLELVASTDPTTVVTPITADHARPLLETVFKVLREQSAPTDLLGREKLTPAEYQPYCQLVIAFYEAVLAMPRDDKVNLLRYLYATAAVDADKDEF